MGTSTSKYKIKPNKHHSYKAERPSSPGKPTLKYNLNNVDPETVTIRWDAPAYNGGSKITGYLVEHKRTGSPYWVKASPIKVRQTQLTTCGLEPGWRYQFRVSAENEVGLSDPSPLSEPLAIFVHRSAAIAPYFITELKDFSALENEKIEFSVNFEGFPAPKISWYKDGLEIFSNRCQKISTEGYTSRFIIYEASVSNKSEIKCTATNTVGYAVTKAYLNVEAPPTIRLPHQYEDGLIFEEGELIRLKVSVDGEPEPLLFWYLNGIQINSTGRYNIEYADKTAILKVQYAERSDRGEYLIHAVNDLGEDEASVLVTIARRPHPPTRLTVEKIDGKAVTLSWLKPEDDGGCKIGSYIIEYYKTGWNIWLKAITSRQLCIKLDDLIEASQYKFRVKAENPYGVSDPSSETEFIFIPDIKNNIFRMEDARKHQLETEIFNFSIQTDFESQTSETDYSSDNLERNKLLAPEKPKRRKTKRYPSDESSNRSVTNEDHSEDQRTLAPSPQQSTNTNYVSRRNSELMLVLVPSNEDLAHIRERAYGDDVFPTYSSNLVSVPPPISLSAPELGTAMQLFKPLNRNCISSTEILRESTIARFYRELQEEDAINKLKQQYNDLSSKQIPDDFNRNSDSSRYNENDSVSTKPKGDSISSLHDTFKSLSNYENNNIANKFGRRKRHAKLLASACNDNFSTNNTSSCSLGRYSPKSGIFHYPDLFVESLTRSPKFKHTPSYTTKTKYSSTQSTSREIPTVTLTKHPENEDVTGNTRHNSYPSTFSSKSIDPSSDTELDYWNKGDNNDDTENSLSEDDETSSDENDFDYDIENNTYHPSDRGPLSFEQALAISNPKLSVTPTNDVFMENELPYHDEQEPMVELHYFNRNFKEIEDAPNLTENSRDKDQRLKPILKNSIRNEFYSCLPQNKSILQAPSQSNKVNGSPKKQVRIEEPSIGPAQSQEGDASDVAINHYSDIVRQYGAIQKPLARIYLTYDELKAAAQFNEDLPEHVIDNEIRERISNVNQSSLSSDLNIANNRTETLNINSQEAQIRQRVHFLFDFFIDITMFISACWLYCFKDERLAIPIVILMVYRQLYEKIKTKFAIFKFWEMKPPAEN